MREREPATSVPDWLLERLARGELPAGRAAELRARLEAAGELHRLEALAASDREILASLPAAAVAAEVRRRAGAAEARAPRRSPARLALLLPLGAMAAALLLLVVRPRPDAGSPSAFFPEGPETITVKGARPALHVYRKAAKGPEELLDGTKAVRPGDTLQVRYVSAGRRFGVVASVDARGAVTLHLPEAPGRAAALERDGERALPHAFELDGAPGFERFVFVAADEPFDTGLVTQALTGGAAPEKAAARLANVAIWNLTLKKEIP